MSVAIIDSEGNVLREMDKLEAHHKGALHLAFSIQLLYYNSELDELELLIQQRAPSKYHSGGLWSNSCCSHHLDHLALIESAQQRLYEEINISASLQVIGDFRYNVQLTPNISENEWDYVLVGFLPEKTVPPPNPDEASDIRWITIDNLEHELSEFPEKFTYWFPEVLNITKKWTSEWALSKNM